MLALGINFCLEVRVTITFLLIFGPFPGFYYQRHVIRSSIFFLAQQVSFPWLPRYYLVRFYLTSYGCISNVPYVAIPYNLTWYKPTVYNIRGVTYHTSQKFWQRCKKNYHIWRRKRKFIKFSTKNYFFSSTFAQKLREKYLFLPRKFCVTVCLPLSIAIIE